MHATIATDVLRVIREERARRIAALPSDPDAADDRWLFRDGPFVNDLCLMLLVAIRHELERALFTLAARVTGAGEVLTRGQYRDQLAATQKAAREKGGFAKAMDGRCDSSRSPNGKTR